MLTLIQKAPEGQGTDPPARFKRKRRRTLPPLTDAESSRVRASITNLFRQVGSSWSCLAAMLTVSGVALQHISCGRARASAAVALRVARATGIAMEALLSGLVDAGKCSTCGQRIGGAS
jgi:hypothetical protein